MAASLEQVARHLGEVDGHPRLTVGAPAGEGWWTLAGATAGMHAWFGPLVEQHGDRRVAAAHVSSWVAGAPAVVVGLCAILGGVVPRAAPDRLVEQASAELPIGRTAVWGGLADAITAFALMFSRQSGRDQQDDWRRCEVLLDGLAHHAPLRVRPTPLHVEWSRGPSLYPVRGTCCLHYRTCDDPDPDGEGYCTTCPLRTADSRIRRLRHHLEASGRGAAPARRGATGRTRRGSGARTG